MYNWKEELQRFWGSAQRRHHDALEIKPKSSNKRLWKILEFLHKVVTFGQGKSLYSGFFTTWGRTVYTPGDGTTWEKYPDGWKWGSQRHELAHFDHMYYGRPDLQAEIHLAQSNGSTDWNVLDPQEKPVWYRYWHGFKYIMWLPFKFSWYRQEVEYWGYLQQVRQSVWEHKGKCTTHTQQWVFRQFHAASYGWMATKKRATELVNRMVAQAEEEYRDGTLGIIMFGVDQ